MAELTRYSGMSDVSSPSTASETNLATRYSDYSGYHGYPASRSSAATRGVTESECHGDVSSTEMTSEQGHVPEMLTSKHVAMARSVHDVAIRGCCGSSSDASPLQSVEADMSDTDVVQKRRKLTDTGFSEDESQVSCVNMLCHMVLSSQKYVYDDSWKISKV